MVHVRDGNVEEVECETLRWGEAGFVLDGYDVVSFVGVKSGLLLGGFCVIVDR